MTLTEIDARILFILGRPATDEHVAIWSAAWNMAIEDAEMICKYRQLHDCAEAIRDLKAGA